jgi:hypothetical protein
MVIGATMSLMAFDAPKRMGVDSVDKKSPSRNQVIDPLRPWQHADGRVEHRREFFESWDEWRIAQGSDFDHRCGTPSPPPGSTGGVAGFAGSDCDLQQTVPSDEYDPNHGDLVIPVVVHVIQNDEGTLGWIDRSTIEQQIRILNDDFFGVGVSSTDDTPGAGVRFALAGIDPDGGATIGITWSQNSTWFNDQGAYWESLAWDPERYLNIYTNSGGGAFGYVNQFPAAGFAGETDDRVVIKWTVFGEPGLEGSPNDLGRILTHEVGHYLGLFHTFYDGCDGSDCSQSGDRICDTPSQLMPSFECFSGNSCDGPDAFSNFMNYSWQVCMSEFTPEQIRRMRCTLQTYRNGLAKWSDQCGFACECDLDGDGLVGGSDLGLMLGKFGVTPGDNIACGDFNLDGVVDGNDFGRLLISWGECVEEACSAVPSCEDGNECTLNYCAGGECVTRDLVFCPLCGLPDAESCFELHDSPGCNDADCCEAICNIDPFCCLFSWDTNCLVAAKSGNFPECDD